MRVLKFDVSGQSIKKDPDCNFDGIVKGTKGYLQAEFTFDKEWDGCKIAAVFTKYGKEYAAPLKNNVCEIPDEALTYKEFSVKVVGVRNDYRITTNSEKVMQNE